MFVSFPPSSKTDILANFFMTLLKAYSALTFEDGSVKKTAPYN